MISIRKNVDELERCHQVRDLALECYVSALRIAAQYAIELDPQLTMPHREYLNRLASEVTRGDMEVLEESRATVRALLRDYRDKGSEFLAKMRDELTGTARALQEILEGMAQGDGDHEAKLRTSIGRLRSISNSVQDSVLRDALGSTAAAIETSLEEIAKQHQVTVSQFLTEIRVLHKRIDALESAAAVDDLTKLFNRGEIEHRLRNTPGAYCLLLIRASGLRMAAVHYGSSVGAELAGAFTKRLKNSLPAETVIGRWAEEDFVAVLHASNAEVMNSGKYIGEHLGGSYACVQNGKTVRPALQLRIGVVESSGDKPDKILERVAGFLTK